MRRHLCVVIAVLLAASGSLAYVSKAQAQSSPSPSAQRTPQLRHAIVCRYHPNVPFQWFGPGTTVSAEAHITCNDAPDVSSTTVRIWRYDLNRGRYYLVGENTSNHTGTDWWMRASGPCTAQRPYKMHTEVINDAFHGNWGHTDVNSSAVTLRC